MRSLYLLALTLLLSGVAGCDSRPRATLNREAVQYNVNGTVVTEFTLADGTRCVIYIGNNVTCEWQRPVILVPRPQ